MRRAGDIRTLGWHVFGFNISITAPIIQRISKKHTLMERQIKHTDNNMHRRIVARDYRLEADLLRSDALPKVRRCSCFVWINGKEVIIIIIVSG